MPSLHDIHQDHLCIGVEGVRAFKQISILGYELPWNNLTFNTQLFVFLDEKHIDKKIEASNAMNLSLAGIMPMKALSVR
jgi:hypothetical protein